MIKILVDSGADCPDKFDGLIPLQVNVDGTEYADGMDLTADMFYEKLQEARDFPKTSQPSPEAFAAVFSQAKAAGDQVLCFTLSSGLSGTYQSACIGKEMAEYENVHIIDTLGVTHCIAILAEYAQTLVAQDLPAGEIARRCEALKGRVRVLAGLDTLEYLHKGGRLSRTSAAVGQLAGIKPVVTLTPEGTVAVAAKTIGVPRAMQTILSRMPELDPDFPLYTIYSQGTGHVEVLEQKLAAAGYPVAERRQVGPTIGAHVGPGIYGVIFVAK